MMLKFMHSEWKEPKYLDFREPIPYCINIPMPGKAVWAGDYLPGETTFSIAEFRQNVELSKNSGCPLYTVDGK
jgi:hypothetical protein